MKETLMKALLDAERDYNNAEDGESSMESLDFYDGIRVGLHRAIDIVVQMEAQTNNKPTNE